MAAGDWKEMFMAAQQNDIDLVYYHLRNGIDPNHQHPEFMTTALIESIQYQNYEVAKLLLEHGADPAMKEHFGNHTPLSMAKSTKNKQLIDLVKTYLHNQ